MKTLIHQPYKIIWASIPLIFLLSFLRPDDTFDFQMHDTYFVMASIHIVIAIAILLLVIGFAYWLFRNKKLVNWMTLGHVIPTILILLLIAFFSMTSNNWRDMGYEYFRRINNMVVISFLLFVLLQLLLLVNLIISALKNENK
jgi:heme/copper-type cytochrome/quinol oxidase subunit 1